MTLLPGMRRSRNRCARCWLRKKIKSPRRTLGVTPEEPGVQTREWVRRYRAARKAAAAAIVVVALAPSHLPTSAREQPKSGEAMPFASALP